MYMQTENDEVEGKEEETMHPCAYSLPIIN